MKNRLKKIANELKEMIAEARNESVEELTEEEREHYLNIEACEHEMEIAEGGFRECLEMIDLPEEQKEEIAYWFRKYASNARALILLMQTSV